MAARSTIIDKLPLLSLAMGLAVTGARSGHAEGIRGYYDPLTRTFTPLAHRAAKIAAPALTKVSGTFKIAVSIKVEPHIPANVKLVGSVTVTAQDPARYNPALQYTTNLGNYLTRSGNSATTSFTVPYIYELADPNAPVTFQLTVAEKGSPPTTLFQPQNGRTVTISLPKSGTTTSIVLGDTL